MIYTVSDEKYRYGERTEKQTSLNVIKAQKLHLGEEAVFGTPLSEHCILLLLLSGGVMYDGRKIEKGNVISVSKFTKFELTACDTADVIAITFDYSENIALFDEKIRVIKAPADVWDCMKRIYDNNFFCNLLEGVNEGLFLNALSTLNILCNSCTVEINLYQKCRGFIESNSEKYITAEVVAEAMSCSVAHLNRIVKKHSGKCLCNIIAEVRIGEIKSHIKNGRLTTKEIADVLDFESPELLRKFFKYHTGISIKDYKMSVQI